jgi:uncharacterized RDD family membrane protein YckC
MSTTPPEQPPIPAGYKPGDYIPFKDRDPGNPSAIAGQWADPARQAQMGGGRPMSEQERYRAIYGYDAPSRVTYASWPLRVLGSLIDFVFGLVAAIPLFVGYWMIYSDIQLRTDIHGNKVIDESTDVSSASIGMFLLGLAIALAFNIYNVWVRQGRTGYTLGKSAMGIRLVRESTGEPVGVLMSFVRQIAHYVDSLICYLGWLWPLWDAKHQTIGDKIMGTVVVVQSPDTVR